MSLYIASQLSRELLSSDESSYCRKCTLQTESKASAPACIFKSNVVLVSMGKELMGKLILLASLAL